MKIILETKEDLKEIIEALELDNKEIIIQNKLSHYLISEYEQLKRDNKLLASKLYFETNNIIKDIIKERIDLNNCIAENEGYKDISDSETKKETIKSIKTELDALKVKKDITANDISKTNFLFEIYQNYEFMHPANINKVISKLEKDLIEIET